jgi:FkbH-like protein
MKIERQIKCLVWDLDNTIWTGTLAEDGRCRLQDGMVSVLNILDSRGILMSIASANDDRPALARLEQLNILHYFIQPRINWDNKVKNIRDIAGCLGLSLDTIGFIDDEPFERAQVRMLLPGVRTYAAEDYRGLGERSEFKPQFLSEEARHRREMYIQSERRAVARKKSRRSRDDFLQWTRTRMRFRPARDTDFERIMELMNRTSQLNATGIIYRPDEARRFLEDDDYRVFVAELTDRFVDYGKIGVAICHRGRRTWRLLSFLVSCRVLSRGISTVFLNLVRHEARKAGAEYFEAQYRQGERNRKMRLLYTLNGLDDLGRVDGGCSLYGGKSCDNPVIPKWLTLIKETSHEKMSRPVDRC